MKFRFATTNDKLKDVFLVSPRYTSIKYAV